MQSSLGPGRRSRACSPSHAYIDWLLQSEKKYPAQRDNGLLEFVRLKRDLDNPERLDLIMANRMSYGNLFFEFLIVF